MGQSRSWPAQGWAGEYRTPPAALDGHFEHLVVLNPRLEQRLFRVKAMRSGGVNKKII
jgi:hypothetical protein